MKLSGSLERDYQCTVQQAHERDRSDAGSMVTVVTLVGATYSPRRVNAAFSIVGRPVVGRQGDSAFGAVAHVTEASATWEALTYGRPEGATGTMSVTLGGVRLVRSRMGETYELHGTLDAKLLPTVEGTATGAVDLHVVF